MKKDKVEKQLKLLKGILEKDIPQVEKLSQVQSWWRKNLPWVTYQHYEYRLDAQKKEGIAVYNRYLRCYIDEVDGETEDFLNVFPSLVLERLERISKINFHKLWKEL